MLDLQPRIIADSRHLECPVMITFDKLDLNLTRAFDTVVEERSVLRASQCMHLSQSSASHALFRLIVGLPTKSTAAPPKA